MPCRAAKEDAVSRYLATLSTMQSTVAEKDRVIARAEEEHVRARVCVEWEGEGVGWAVARCCVCRALCSAFHDLCWLLCALASVFSVACSVFVLCALCSVLCALCFELRVLCYVLCVCALSFVLCALCSVLSAQLELCLRALGSVFSVACSMPCT